MIDRADFVPEQFRETARLEPEVAVPLVNGITVPGVSVTRLMAALLDLEQGQKLLLVGTGSGYQTAWIAEQYGVFVDSLDIRSVPGLAEKMPRGVRLWAMDGLAETPVGEVYDAILVTCGVPLPMVCWAQCLKAGGVLVAPVGGRDGQAIRKYLRKGVGLDDVGDFAYASFVAAELLMEHGVAMNVYDVVTP